jgi:hypothetical protein
MKQLGATGSAAGTGLASFGGSHLWSSRRCPPAAPFYEVAMTTALPPPARALGVVPRARDR